MALRDNADCSGPFRITYLGLQDGYRPIPCPDSRQRQSSYLKF
jgi:hypothetical protein